MQWNKVTFDNLDDKKVYSHRMLVNELKTIKPDLSDSAYQWAITILIRSGTIAKMGYDSYALSIGVPKKEYNPVYSKSSLELIALICEEYPYVQFTVFETILLNDYLNHLIAQNTIFLQVEKESSIYIFRFLQECGYTNIMYKPNKEEYDLYWSSDCIVITDLISQAPLKKENQHSIMLEKMLVDILADKLISSTYSKNELSDIFKQALNKYLVDKVRMLRYAGRRNKEKEIREYLEEVK